MNLAPMKHMLDQHIAGEADHGKRLYALVMLAMWARSASPTGRA
jgi:hypothetical protein